MAAALILTEDAAAAHGFAGVGPFTFGAVFPGEFQVGRPVEITELGFDDEDTARDALADAFDGDPPLELVDVEPGEGRAVRVNHAPAQHENPDSELVDQVVDDTVGGKIRTHAQADAVAAELGVTFPDGATVAEKVAAIDELRAGAELTADHAVALDEEDEV